MTIYLLVREDQNQHGFVDTGVIGAFHKKEDAEARLRNEARNARKSGTRVEGQAGCPLDEWDVALRVEEHALI